MVQGGNFTIKGVVTNLLINSISNSGSNRNVSEVKTSNMSDVSKNSNGIKMGEYRPDRKLPRDNNGNPIPDANVPHTNWY